MPEQPDTVSFPITLRHEHRLIFTRDAFAEANAVLADVPMPREPGDRIDLHEIDGPVGKASFGELRARYG